MKYLNILAGAFGLMALAACTNDDEVTKIEQPKGLYTITVAYNQGADTRFLIEPKTVPFSQYAEQGMKGSWQDGDKIALIDKAGNKSIYETIEVAEGGQEATFALMEGEAKPTEGEDYTVVYPSTYDGNLDNFANQKASSYSDFPIENYFFATGTTTLSGGQFSKTTLTPLFSFIYIPEDIRLINMAGWGFEKDYDVSEGSSLDMSIGIVGTNLYYKIENFTGVTRSTGINLGEAAIARTEDKVWKNELPKLIAIPVLPGQEPVTNLGLDFDGAKCDILDKDGVSPLTIDQGGKIYVLSDTGKNLQFQLGIAVGRVLGANGKYYATVSDAEAAGTKGEAMVGSVSSPYSYAIALEDASNELLSPDVAKGFIFNNDYEWCKNHAIDGDYNDWSTPQISIFGDMINSCGGLDQFNARLEAAGGSKMNAGKYICSDTGVYPNYYVYDFVNNKSEVVPADTEVYTRAYFLVQ